MTLRNQTGMGLARAASALLEEESRTLRSNLEFQLLPICLEAVWQEDPNFSQIRASSEEFWQKSPLPSLANTLVTFLGEPGRTRAASYLIGAGFSHKDAEQVSEHLGDYCRQPLSALNLARHLRTATNYAMKVLGLTTSGNLSDRLDTEISEEFSLLLARGTELRESNIRDSENLVPWLNELEALMETTIKCERNLKFSLIKRQNSASFEQSAHALAATYRRRFSRYIALAFELTNIEGSFSSAVDLSLSAELERVTKRYSGSYSEIFKQLQQDYSSKEARTSTGRTRALKKPTVLSPIEHVQRFSIEGRQLTVSTSDLRIEKELIALLLKNIALQIELNMNSNLLAASAKDVRQEISLTLEHPQNSDVGQITRLLDKLF